MNSIELTPKTFTALARSLQEGLAQYVGLPKGHYCHILEATARGLGFSSKTDLDATFKSNSLALIPASAIEAAAVHHWLVHTGLPPTIPHDIFQKSLLALWPALKNFARTSSMKVFKKPNISKLATATSDIVSRYASVIWSTADVLRGIGCKASEWPNHMMPFFALMLVESRAKHLRNQALSNFGDFDPSDSHDVADFKAAYMSAAAHSPTFHEDLVLHGQDLAHVASGGPSGFEQRLHAYLNGFDVETRKLLGINPGNAPKTYLNIDGSIRYLAGHGGEHLWHYCKIWSQVDLSSYDSSAITTLEEHIKRKWADISADTAGEHYTPADLIQLVAAISLSHLRRHPLEGNFLRIYDPTCGGGNMLYGVAALLQAADKEGSLRNKSGQAYSFQIFGQELNDQLFSLASIEAGHHEHAVIREGNTLSNDRFTGEKFNVIVANPPYGTDWKQIQKDIEADQTGRFPSDCRPSVSDGQQLFLQHIQHHLSDDGIAMVFCSGSTLFSGDAGSGESNARRQYILKDDGVWGLIQLPKNEFFNTGINTYVWVFWKGKPQELKNKMFFLNAESMFQKMRKSMGSKNSELSPYDQFKVTSLIEAAEDFSSTLNSTNALTIDLGNRTGEAGIASVSGWKSSDGQLSASSDDVSAFQEKLEVMSEVWIKTIGLKEATKDEPVFLRLLDVEDIHYNKVSLELRRGGPDALKGSPVDLKKCAIRVFLGQNEDSESLWLNSGHTVTEIRAALEDGRARGLLNCEVIPENDPKAVEAAVKLVLEESPFKVFDAVNVNIQSGIYTGNDEQRHLAGYSYRLSNKEDEVLDTKSGNSLGVGVIKIKTAVAKGTKGKTGQRQTEDGGTQNTMNFSATVGPKMEKDTENTPYRRSADANEQEISAFLSRWVKDSYTRGEIVVGCEINFNRLFPKTGERKTVQQIEDELNVIESNLATLKKGDV